MQDFWYLCFSTQPHSSAKLFCVCTKFVNPTCIAICQSSTRSIQSVHLNQTFGLTLIGLRHKKIKLRIKSGLQEAFSRISQPIYSRVASGTTSRPENCQEMCRQHNFQQNHLRFYNLPIYGETLQRRQITKMKTGYCEKSLMNQKLPGKIVLLHIGLFIYDRTVAFLTQNILRVNLNIRGKNFINSSKATSKCRVRTVRFSTLTAAFCHITYLCVLHKFHNKQHIFASNAFADWYFYFLFSFRGTITIFIYELYQYTSSEYLGRTGRRRLLTAEDRFRQQVNPYEICCGGSDIRTSFPLSILVPHVSVLPRTLGNYFNPNPTLITRTNVRRVGNSE